MAYTLPTPAEFKTRFPEFATTDDARVQLFLDDAARSIDTSWLEADYSPAIQYLAAHLLSSANSAAAGEIVGEKGPITSESFSGMSRSYGTKELTAAQKSSYGGTSYGQEYYRMLVKNKPGVMVVF